MSHPYCRGPSRRSPPQLRTLAVGLAHLPCRSNGRLLPASSAPCSAAVRRRTRARAMSRARYGTQGVSPPSFPKAPTSFLQTFLRVCFVERTWPATTTRVAGPGHDSAGSSSGSRSEVELDKFARGACACGPGPCRRPPRRRRSLPRNPGVGKAFVRQSSRRGVGEAFVRRGHGGGALVRRDSGGCRRDVGSAHGRGGVRSGRGGRLPKPRRQ